MPRHSSLIPLSHDHHHGLVVALRLKKGGPASLNDPWLAGEENQVTQLLHFADSELLNHFLLEEEELFPVLTLEHGLAPLLDQLIAEHNMMRGLLGSIRDSPAKHLLKEFGELLEQHIRKEERVLFPLIEQAISEERVQIPGEIIKNRHGSYSPPPVC